MSTVHVRVSAVLVAIATVLLVQAAQAQWFTVEHQGRERRYLLRVPPGSGEALPLVLVFHGGSVTPASMETASGFSQLGAREAFLVAYPEGIQKHWGDGRGTTPPDKLGIDDVGFTRAAIADIEKRHAIDRRRIYATGASNGGFFVIRLACEAPDILAAVGPVIAALPSALRPGCKPAAPISVIGIQGVADPVVPFAGGEEGGERHLGTGGRIEGARATQKFFAEVNDCVGGPTIETLAPRVDDATTVDKRSFSACRNGTEVVWYEIEGGGHRWPPHRLARPAAERLMQRALGVSSQNIDAAEVLWSFFRGHPKS